MVEAQRFLSDFNSSKIQSVCLGIYPLEAEFRGHIRKTHASVVKDNIVYCGAFISNLAPFVERPGHIRMLRTQNLLSYGLRPLIECLCYSIVALLSK